MVDIEEIIDKANVKEFLAVTVGLVGSKIADGLMVSMDAKQRDLIKVGVGLGGAFVANDFAEKSPKYGEILALGGLAATAFGAKPVADRVSVEVSKRTGTPIVVQKPVSVGRGVDMGTTVIEEIPTGGSSRGR